MGASGNLGGRSVCVETATLKLEGVHSITDFERVQDALAAIRGVAVTSISLTSGELTLVYDQRKVTPEELRSAVRGAGFAVWTITLQNPDESAQANPPWE